MRFTDVILSALTQIRANKLRSFFTLLGVIVSVTFLVAVVAIIQGMNAYVRENVAGAIIGANSFQVRRTPINFARSWTTTGDAPSPAARSDPTTPRRSGGDPGCRGDGVQRLAHTDQADVV